jgi:hypothetical protein
VGGAIRILKRRKKMIHVRISLEYRGIPFEVEMDAQNPSTFMFEGLDELLERIKRFIDAMLEAKKEAKP